MSAPIVAVFADGGCIGRNPSAVGGTWAWAHVDADNNRVDSESGVIPANGGVVTNNLSEFVALVRGLLALPEGWSGEVFSDSQVTLGRLFWGWRLTHLPAGWVKRGDLALRRVGVVTAVLLSGHPTKTQLAVGVGRGNRPVSAHNVFCDRACREAGAVYLARRGVK